LSLSAGVTTSNLNISASSGYRANGEVQEQNTSTLLAGVTVTAFDGASNRYDTVYTDANGHYDLYLPTNTPLVIYAGAAGYPGEFYENAYDPAEAAPLWGMTVYSHVYVPFTLYAAATDSDGDGLADYLEDSVPDGVFNAGDDYSDPIIVDTDADGMDDGDEYIAGTSSQDSSSLFQIVDAEAAAEPAWIAWSSVAGRHYTVKYCSDLMSGSWSNVYSVTASGPQTTYFTENLPGDTGYLRVDVSSE
ncbi:MAG TPA: hypothetical protein VJ904_05985, partial [Tichowtungia sp.]|nr:hypothetical protein [Tichowtungia sp.]